MFDPLLDKSPAPPAAGASANPPSPSVALAASPPPRPLLQPPVTPSPPPPMSFSTPPRSTTAPSRPTLQTTAPSTSPPPRPPPPSTSPPQQAGAAPYTSLSRLLGAAPRPRGLDIHAGGSGGGRSGVHTDSTGSGDDEPQSIALLGRLLWRRKRNPSLPVIQPASVPNSGGMASRITAWFQTFRCDLMPDPEIHKRLAIFGFVLYGIMLLLPTTQNLIKGFPPNHQVAILFVVGFVCTLSSTGAGCTIFGRTSLEHAVAKLATWVGMIGITLLVIFHIGLMLPQNYWRKECKLNKLSATVFVILVCFAIAGYLIPLTLNKVCGEKEKMQDQQIRSSEVIQTFTS